MNTQCVHVQYICLKYMTTHLFLDMQFILASSLKYEMLIVFCVSKAIGL